MIPTMIHIITYNVGKSYIIKKNASIAMEKALIKTRYELRNGNSEKLILLKNLRTGFDVFDKLLPNMISIESLIILKGIVPIKVIFLINIRKYLFAFDKFSHFYRTCILCQWQVGQRED